MTHAQQDRKLFLRHIPSQTTNALSDCLQVKFYLASSSRHCCFFVIFCIEYFIWNISYGIFYGEYVPYKVSLLFF